MTCIDFDRIQGSAVAVCPYEIECSLYSTVVMTLLISHIYGLVENEMKFLEDMPELVVNKLRS